MCGSIWAQFMPRRGACYLPTSAMKSANLGFEIHGNGPALLLIHGFPFNRTMWRSATPFINGRQVICPDLSGMGSSPAGVGTSTLRFYADGLLELLDELRLEQCQPRRPGWMPRPPRQTTLNLLVGK